MKEKFEYNPYQSGHRLFMLKIPSFINKNMRSYIRTPLFDEEKVKKNIDIFNNHLYYIKNTMMKYVIKRNIFFAQRNGDFNKTDKDYLMFLTNTSLKLLLFPDFEANGLILRNSLYGASGRSYSDPFRKTYNKFLLELKCYIQMYRLKLF